MLNRRSARSIRPGARERYTYGLAHRGHRKDPRFVIAAMKWCAPLCPHNINFAAPPFHQVSTVIHPEIKLTPPLRPLFAAAPPYAVIQESAAKKDLSSPSSGPSRFSPPFSVLMFPSLN